MASLISFVKIDKQWARRRGMFEVIFGTLYELYLDKSKAPSICAHLLPMIRNFLHDCWPDRYEKPDGLRLDYLPFSDYPAREQRELLRATERLLEDFKHDRLDPHLDWNWELKPYFVSALRELVDLMREEIAASHSLRVVRS